MSVASATSSGEAASPSSAKGESKEQSTTVAILRAIVGIGVLGCIGCGVIFGRQYLSFSYLADNHRRLEELVEANFFEAGCAYISCMTFLIGLTMPGATVLSFAGGVLFPQPYAAAFAYTGYVLGAMLSFSLVTFVLADTCRKRLEPFSKFRAFQKNVRKNALLYLVLARYTFVFPFWFVNSCSAVLGVSFKTFVLATNLSVIPGSIVYTSAGRSLGNLLAAGQRETDPKALLWSALSDPNVQWCLGGVTACLMFAIVASRMADSGEEHDETAAVDTAQQGARKSRKSTDSTAKNANEAEAGENSKKTK
ncbi:unnamed protein product [Amoebophrya sp. A120]|nr:unnamed protein product [Amoebophrya sp. A120]|eukprot:GSA120T00018568001.1